MNNDDSRFRRLNRRNAERLLHGEVPPGAPPEVRTLDRILDAAADHGHPEELAGEAATVSAFRAVHTNAATQQFPLAYPPRPRALPWWLATKVAAAATLVAAAVTGLAVAGPVRDELPRSTSNGGPPPIQSTAPQGRPGVTGRPGVPPDATASPVGGGGADSPSPSAPGAASPPPASPPDVASLASFQNALAQEAAAGRVQPQLTQELQDLARKAQAALTAGDTGEATKPLNDIGQKITDGRSKVTIEGSAADRLMTIIGPLLSAATAPEATLPAPTPEDQVNTDTIAGTQ